MLSLRDRCSFILFVARILSSISKSTRFLTYFLITQSPNKWYDISFTWNVKTKLALILIVCYLLLGNVKDYSLCPLSNIQLFNKINSSIKPSDVLKAILVPLKIIDAFLLYHFNICDIYIYILFTFRKRSLKI